MNTNQSSTKSYIIIGAIFIVGFLLIFYYMGGKGESGSLLESGVDTQNSEVGTRVLALLNQIQSLKIDDSLFAGAAYQTLIDFSVTIPEQDVGRPNPFAPLPGMISNTRTTR